MQIPEIRKEIYNHLSKYNKPNLKKYNFDNYEVFEKRIMSSYNNKSSSKPPYKKTLNFQYNKVFNYQIVLIKIIGVICCTLFIFFALKGIGRKKGEEK
jgi:hypothetical protein